MLPGVRPAASSRSLGEGWVGREGQWYKEDRKQQSREGKPKMLGCEIVNFSYKTLGKVSEEQRD